MLKKATIILDDGGLGSIDVIEHENKHWLVPKWWTDRNTGMSKPERMILLNSLQHQMGAQITVNEPIPRAVLEGPLPSGLGPQFVVRLEPDAPLVRLAKTLN